MKKGNRDAFKVQKRENNQLSKSVEKGGNPEQSNGI